MDYSGLELIDVVRTISLVKTLMRKRAVDKLIRSDRASPKAQEDPLTTIRDIIAGKGLESQPGMEELIALFAKVTEWIQEYENVQFVPVIAHSDRNDDDAAQYVWSLADLMDIDDGDLPHIYLLDPHTQKSIPYPTKMDKLEDFSPEVVFAWAEYEKAIMD